MIPLTPANVKLPETGNPWLDYILGAIIPVCLGVLYLLYKWLRKYLKNKIKEQDLKDKSLTQEINND